MAIQPIDLQTLFTQMDKVGKAQAEQREGLAIQQSLQSVQMQKKNDIRNESVNESRDPGEEGSERIRDKNAENGGGEGERERKKREEDAEDHPLPVIRDTSVGKIIDLSG